MTGRRQLAVTIGVLGVIVALLFVGKRILGNEIAPLGVGAEAPNFTAQTLDAAPVQRSLDQYCAAANYPAMRRTTDELIR